MINIFIYLLIDSIIELNGISYRIYGGKPLSMEEAKMTFDQLEKDESGK